MLNRQERENIQSTIYRLFLLDNFLDFYKGNFEAIIKRVPNQARNIETALSLHLQGDTTAAIKLMDNELKMYRKEDKSIQAFPIFSFNFF